MKPIWKKTEAPYIITLVLLMVGGFAMVPLSVYAESNDDNDEDDDNSYEFSELGKTSPVQEENVQGRTITGSSE
jgi:hypothetical protein